jgi:hypothetical protein
MRVGISQAGFDARRLPNNQSVRRANRGKHFVLGNSAHDKASPRSSSLEFARMRALAVAVRQVIVLICEIE